MGAPEPNHRTWSLLSRLLAASAPRELAAGADELLAHLGRLTGARRAFALSTGEHGWEGRIWRKGSGTRPLVEADRAELDWELLERPPERREGAGHAALSGAALATRPRLAALGLASLRIAVVGAGETRSAVWLEDPAPGATGDPAPGATGDPLVPLALFVRALHALRLRSEVEDERARRAELSTTGEGVRAVAHDLRNDLAVARLRVEGLRDPALGPAERAEHCAELARELDRGGALCRALLAGSVTPAARSETVALRELLTAEARRAALGVDARARRVRLRVACPRALEVRLPRTPLARLVANLVSNALHASPAAGTVALSACIEDGAVRVTVADEGGGLDAARRRRLFAAGRSGRAGGTGYGTASAARCAAELGARLAVDSAPGRGTRVHVILFHSTDGGGGAPCAWLVLDPVPVRRRARVRELDRDGGRARGVRSPLELDALLHAHPEARLVVPAVLPPGSWTEALERARALRREVRAHGHLPDAPRAAALSTALSTTPAGLPAVAEAGREPVAVSRGS